MSNTADCRQPGTIHGRRHPIRRTRTCIVSYRLSGFRRLFAGERPTTLTDVGLQPTQLHLEMGAEEFVACSLDHRRRSRRKQPTEETVLWIDTIAETNKSIAISCMQSCQATSQILKAKGQAELQWCRRQLLPDRALVSLLTLRASRADVGAWSAIGRGIVRRPSGRAIEAVRDSVGGTGSTDSSKKSGMRSSGIRGFFFLRAKEKKSLHMSRSFVSFLLGNKTPLLSVRLLRRSSSSNFHLFISYQHHP